jgi:hypothetical protein
VAYERLKPAYKEEQNTMALKAVRQLGGSVLLCLLLLYELAGHFQAAALQRACCLCISVDV